MKVESLSVEEIITQIHSKIDTIVQLACDTELEALSLEEELLIRMIKGEKLSNSVKIKLIQRVTDIQVAQIKLLGSTYVKKAV